jgi:hypothetical protein
MLRQAARDDIDTASLLRRSALQFEQEHPMPIRHPLTLAFTVTAALTGAIACGSLLVPAQAADARADMRDLKPTPARPTAHARRPEVALRASASVVPIGAPVTFEVSSSINGFGHIYVLSASGRVQVWLENAPITAGQRLVFPIGETGIKAAAPAGREDLMLIVTRERVDGFFGYDGTSVPRLLDYSQVAFKRKLTDKFLDLPHQQWGYARTSVQVVERLASGSSSGWGLGAGADSAPPNLWAGQWEKD